MHERALPFKILTVFLVTLFVSPSLFAQNGETRLLHHINGWGGTPFTNFNKAVTFSEGLFVIGVPVGMGIYDLCTRDADHFHKTLGISASIVAVYAFQLCVKPIVGRERPFVKYPGYIHNRVSESGYSFPSNHTGGAFALATSLSFYYPKWYIIAPAYVWATAVGLSRLQLGVHYPTDVLAGACFGFLSGWGSYELQKRLLPNKKRVSKENLKVMQAYSLY